MNEDILSGNWKQLKGNVKKTWGKLTDDDLTAIGGQRDLLAGKIQERYGLEKDAAMEEIKRFERENRL
jgi:uncharacterized protein YjbJ (UPF0337 family)